LHAKGGLLFSFITAGFAGGVLSEIAFVLFLQWRQWHRENIQEMIFKFFLLGFIGTLTDLLYHAQHYLFGDNPGWLGFIAQIGIDQLLFSPLVSTFIVAVMCDWYKDGFIRARIPWWFKPGYYTAVVLPVLITSWFFWFPMTIIIYSAPNTIRFPLDLIAMAC